MGLKQFLDGPVSIRIRELNLSNCIHLSDVSIVKLSERYDKTIKFYIISLEIVYLLIGDIRDRPSETFGKHQETEKLV